MMTLMEPLENRVLFSLSSPIGGLTGNLLQQAFQQASAAFKADKGALAADGKAFHAAVQSWAPVYKADLKLLAADLKALPKNPQNVQLLNALRTDQNTCTATLRHDFAVIMATTHGFVTRMVADALGVVLHPTDTTISGKLTADASSFQTAFNAAMTQFGTDVAACGAKLTADADALVAANPTDTQLATDEAKLKSDGATVFASISSALTQSQTDLAKLFSDMAVPG